MGRQYSAVLLTLINQYLFRKTSYLLVSIRFTGPNYQWGYIHQTHLVATNNESLGPAREIRSTPHTSFKRRGPTRRRASQQEDQLAWIHGAFSTATRLLHATQRGGKKPRWSGGGLHRRGNRHRTMYIGELRHPGFLPLPWWRSILPRHARRTCIATSYEQACSTTTSSSAKLARSHLPCPSRLTDMGTRLLNCFQMKPERSSICLSSMAMGACAWSSILTTWNINRLWSQCCVASGTAILLIGASFWQFSARKTKR